MKITLHLLLLLFTINTFAQNENSLLWRISGNGLQKPSFVYGTIHLACPNDILITDSMKVAFNNSDQIYMEVDMDDPDMLKKTQSRMTLPNGQNIKDFLSSKDYKTVDAHLTSKMGVGLDKLGTMKPFAIFSIVLATALPCDSKGYETVFASIAKEQKKEIYGLETIEFQFDMFEKIPNKVFIQLIVDMINQKDLVDKEFNQLIGLYKKHEIDSLLTFMNSSEWNFKGFEEDFIYKRNNEWVPIISRVASEKPTFFAVGAGHLGGEKGVLQLLRQKGYTVKAVK